MCFVNKMPVLPWLPRQNHIEFQKADKPRTVLDNSQNHPLIPHEIRFGKKCPHSRCGKWLNDESTSCPRCGQRFITGT